RKPVGGSGGAIRKEAKVLGRTCRGLAHEAQCLAGIEALDESDLLASRLDQIRDPMQQRAPPLPGYFAPFGERRMRRASRCVHVLLVTRGDLREHTAVDR